MKKKPEKQQKKPETPVKPSALLDDLRRLIDETRQAVAATVNAALTMLHWRIGKRIIKEIFKGGRAGYGDTIVSTLSTQLEMEYGKGFSEKNIRHMVRFAEVFPDERIVSALRRQLSWTHFRTIMYMDDPLKRDFYAEMCRIERWSTRTLQKKIASMLSHKGQMELYLRWLDRYERREGEDSPIGMILCAGKKEEQIELLELRSSGIHVAEYLTALPPKKVLKERLHKAIEIARRRVENIGDERIVENVAKLFER